MLYQRRISRSYNVPELAPGFVGPGHLAAPVIPPEDFELNDPFILLMDDHLDIGDRPVGGPHPHAGFETVTLLLEGSIYDRDEGGVIEAGEVQWMTAGRGIIHGENVGAKGKVRLLQLWLTLPKADRWTEPGFQTIHTDAVPVRRENGAEVRITAANRVHFVPQRGIMCRLPSRKSLWNRTLRSIRRSRVPTMDLCLRFAARSRRAPTTHPSKPGRLDGSTARRSTGPVCCV